MITIIGDYLAESMERGESFEETARREVLEETVLVVNKLKLFYVNSGRDTFYQYPNGDLAYLAGFIYTTTEFTDHLKTDNKETLEVA